MATRFWFVVYNLIFLPLLSGTVKILAPFSRNIKDSLEKREGLWEYFNEQGELFKIQIFENDVLIKCEGKCPAKEEESN